MGNKTIDTLIVVLSNLNSISVSGEENLDKLLGCIQAIKDIIKKCEEGENGR